MARKWSSIDNGTRLYITDRFKDQVRVFRVDPGPFFTQMPRFRQARPNWSARIRATWI